MNLSLVADSRSSDAPEWLRFLTNRSGIVQFGLYHLVAGTLRFGSTTHLDPIAVAPQ
jgi:hypothetical protein